MSNRHARPGDKVELANKEVGFYDPETGLKLVRSQTAKLGPSVGRKTNIALSSGALLVVGKAAASNLVKTDPDLPEDLPGRESFEAAGIRFDQVKAMSPEELDSVKGIGKKTISAIAEYLAGGSKE